MVVSKGKGGASDQEEYLCEAVIPQIWTDIRNTACMNELYDIGDECWIKK